MVGDEKDRAAVDAARERHADRFVRRRIDVPQPPFDLGRHRADVAAADLVERCGQRIRLRREEPRVDRIRVRTAHERDLDDVVGGDHARVARVELIRQAVGRERAVQRVDAVGDVEGRAFVALRQEIAHRPVERPRQPHGHAFGGHERERAVDAANAVRLTREDAAARLVHASCCRGGSGRDRGDPRSG